MVSSLERSGGRRSLAHAPVIPPHAFNRQRATPRGVGPQPYGSTLQPLGVRRHQPKPASPQNLARRRARQRRLQVLQGLLATAGVTLALALVFRGPFLLLHLVADVLLVVFVGLLVQQQRLAAEREMKVTFLPHADTGATPVQLLELRRSAAR